MITKKLNYITVIYDCSDELATQISNQFDIQENTNVLYCINVIKTDDYYINFNYWYKPNYKKMIFINLINIQRIHSAYYFNMWMTVVNMFDEIYDVHEQFKEYRPEIVDKVKLLEIKNNKEIEEIYKENIASKFNMFKYLEDVVTIENHVSIQCENYAVWHGKNKLHIKSFSSIGERVSFIINREHNYSNISSGNIDYKYGHNKWTKTMYDYTARKGDIVVGSDVWIGMNATILGGVNIGDGAVVGANAVVTKDVPPYAIVAGNPAKIIKYRFKKRQIKKLLKIKWWDWPLYKIYDNISLIDSENIDEFINKFYKK